MQLYGLEGQIIFCMENVQTPLLIIFLLIQNMWSGLVWEAYKFIDAASTFPWPADLGWGPQHDDGFRNSYETSLVTKWKDVSFIWRSPQVLLLFKFHLFERLWMKVSERGLSNTKILQGESGSEVRVMMVMIVMREMVTEHWLCWCNPCLWGWSTDRSPQSDPSCIKSSDDDDDDNGGDIDDGEGMGDGDEITISYQNLWVCPWPVLPSLGNIINGIEFQ